MRNLTFAFVLLALPASAAMLNLSDYDIPRLVPPPPAPDSARTKAELEELHALATSTSDERKAAALRDAKDETPDIFNGAIGFDVATAPQTTKLLQIVIEDEDTNTGRAKKYFHRLRPYSVDATVQTCAPVKPGKSPNSYPSGHATLVFAMAEVLAQLLPDKAPAILARASDYAESRLICGVHYRSDITAGQQFGTVIALKLMEKPEFQQQMAAAQTELKSH